MCHERMCTPCKQQCRDVVVGSPKAAAVAVASAGRYSVWSACESLRCVVRGSPMCCCLIYCFGLSGFAGWFKCSRLGWNIPPWSHRAHRIGTSHQHLSLVPTPRAPSFWLLLLVLHMGLARVGRAEGSRACSHAAPAGLGGTGWMCM